MNESYAGLGMKSPEASIRLRFIALIRTLHEGRMGTSLPV